MCNFLIYIYLFFIYLRMFQAKSLFENSLRTNDLLLPKHNEHRKCKGHAHGRGNYNKSNEDNSRAISNGKCNDDTALLTLNKRTSNFGRKFSSFSEKSKSGKIVVEKFRNNNNGKSLKSSSISSGDFSACSSTDSVDTISERLYLQSTKSSQAKRYQSDEDNWFEYFDGEVIKNEKIIKRLLENDKSIKEDLKNCKNVKREKRKSEQLNRKRRRDNLKRVLYDKIELKSTLDLTHDTKIVSSSTLVTGKNSIKKTPPPIPPKPKDIQEKLRRAKKLSYINKIINRNYKYHKTLTIDEAQFIARNRKTLLLGTEKILFKDVEELSRNVNVVDRQLEV